MRSYLFVALLVCSCASTPPSTPADPTPSAPSTPAPTAEPTPPASAATTAPAKSSEAAATPPSAQPPSTPPPPADPVLAEFCKVDPDACSPEFADKLKACKCDAIASGTKRGQCFIDCRKKARAKSK